MRESPPDLTTAEEDVTTPSEPKAKKGGKPKKRPSDFEIIRTILQRTNERKLPFLLKNTGEDEDILFLCSQNEDGFIYGSPSVALTLVEFEDPELKAAWDGIYGKMYGAHSQHQLLINLRDQISELGKTKGETMDTEVQQNEYGTVWSVKTDTRGQERIVYYTKAIESLFHFELVRTWCSKYRPLLQTDDPAHLYYPYTHPDGATGSIVALPPPDDPDHPLSILYPHGFRTMATRGIDLLITKAFEHFPYPIIREEILAVLIDGVTCQLVHRVIGEGWRMILVRPNSILFPSGKSTIPSTGQDKL